MVIYILVNYPEESFKAIKDKITANDIKAEINKRIISKIYELYSTGKFNDVLNFFENQEDINYLSGIMAYDFEITDLNKCIEDLLNIYTKERLISDRNKLIKELENTENKSDEEIKNLEKSLNDVILRLAKVK